VTTPNVLVGYIAVRKILESFFYDDYYLPLVVFLVVIVNIISSEVKKRLGVSGFLSSIFLSGKISIRSTELQVISYALSKYLKLTSALRSES
jgi:hypothetical protein